MAEREFAGKVALVTGTTGIGRASAIRLAQGGAEVLAGGIDIAANQELAAMAVARGLSITALALDLSLIHI